MNIIKAFFPRKREFLSQNKMKFNEDWNIEWEPLKMESIEKDLLKFIL